MRINWLVVAVATSLALDTRSALPGASTVTRFAQLARVARERLRADSGRLWGSPLDNVAWMGVQGTTIHLSARPDTAGYQPNADSLWSGPLPKGISPANTSIVWHGRKWAMVLLPLPDDSLGALRRLLHEAMHTHQPAILPLEAYSETGAGSDVLDGAEGRTALRVELRALAKALDTSDDGAATRDALWLHTRRRAELLPNELQRQRALEINEGLPEYTAWMLSGSPVSTLRASLAAADTQQASYVRTFAYLTGPAYALLADRHAPGWRGASGRVEHPAEQLMARFGAASDSPSGTTDRIAARYGITSVRATERERERKHAQVVREMRTRFVTGPVLRIVPGAIRISFDPGGQLSLGADGTVMRSLRWTRDDQAELIASTGALVSADWKELRVPLGRARFEAGTLTTEQEWTGDGWTLRLPRGWHLARDASGWIALPPMP